jgi:chaperonin GroES
MIKPLGDYIVLRPIIEEKSVSGIIIPDTADKRHPERGEVVYVGNGKVLEDGTRSIMDVKVGDKIVFKKYAPDNIKIEGVEYLVISMSDVMAVIE